MKIAHVIGFVATVQLTTRGSRPSVRTVPVTRGVNEAVIAPRGSGASCQRWQKSKHLEGNSDDGSAGR